MSSASVNLPLIVAGVFAATFVLVCAVAYVFLGHARSRSEPPPSSATARPDPSPGDGPPFAGPDAPSSLDPAASAAIPIGTISPSSRAVPAAPLDPGKLTILRLYRLLMFLTGGSGLVATYLMSTAVEGFSRLLVVALVVFALSLGALYRGFVPDPELTGKK